MTIRTVIVTGDDEGPHHSDGTEAYLSLPNGSVPSITEYPGDIWLKNPTIVEIPDPEMIADAVDGMQVYDPLWAARGLRQALLALAFNQDVRDLIRINQPGMLEHLDAIISITHELATFDPPTIKEETDDVAQTPVSASTS